MPFSIFAPKKPKTLGLALGSGGVRGLAHIGVIKALSQHHIPIHSIAGCSIGSLIGGLFAAWLDINRVEDMVHQYDYASLTSKIKLFYSFNQTFKKIYGQIPEVNIEDLSIPFYAVSTDYQTGSPYVFSEGPLKTAIKASLTIPYLFPYVLHDGRYLLDGGNSMPVPTTVFPSRPDIVLAVNIYSHLYPITSVPSKKHPVEPARNSLYILLYQLALENSAKADFVVSPPLVEPVNLDLAQAKKYIDAGYYSTLEIIPDLKRSLLL